VEFFVLPFSDTSVSSMTVLGSLDWPSALWLWLASHASLVTLQKDKRH